MNNKFNSGKNKYLGLKINFWKKFLFLLHKLIKQKLLANVKIFLKFKDKIFI